MCTRGLVRRFFELLHYQGLYRHKCVCHADGKLKFPKYLQGDSEDVLRKWTKMTGNELFYPKVCEKWPFLSQQITQPTMDVPSLKILRICDSSNITHRVSEHPCSQQMTFKPEHLCFFFKIRLLKKPPCNNLSLPDMFSNALHWAHSFE